MKEVKYRVVRKKLKELKKGDVLCSLEIIKLDPDHFDQKIKISNGVWPKIEEFRHVGILNPDGTYNIMELIEEPAQPEPETRTIEIDGERFTVTREGDGWGKPVPWVLAVGDEVAVGELKQGDKIVIRGSIQKKYDDTGRVEIHVPGFRGHTRNLWSDDLVIYNGRAGQ